jgi:hypothetical protein
MYFCLLCVHSIGFVLFIMIFHGIAMQKKAFQRFKLNFVMR